MQRARSESSIALAALADSSRSLLNLSWLRIALARTITRCCKCFGRAAKAESSQKVARRLARSLRTPAASAFLLRQHPAAPPAQGGGAQRKDGTSVLGITRKTYMSECVAKITKPPPWSGRGNLCLTQTVPCKL